MLIALLLSSLLPAATVQGTVRAAGSREPIAHATVLLPELNRGVLTDQHGYFVIPDIPAGHWRIQAGALGYQVHTLTLQLTARGVVRLEFELAPSPVQLAGVEARATRRVPEVEPPISLAAPGPEVVRIDRQTISTLPGLAQADVFRALQLLPSVAAISDYSSALYVRGGSPDQTLVTLDGVPLYNPYRMGGLFSAVDPGAVASVDVLAGALPPGSGDRLSSAVAIHTRAGGRDRVRGWGSSRERRPRSAACRSWPTAEIRQHNGISRPEPWQHGMPPHIHSTTFTLFAQIYLAGRRARE